MQVRRLIVLVLAIAVFMGLSVFAVAQGSNANSAGSQQEKPGSGSASSGSSDQSGANAKSGGSSSKSGGKSGGMDAKFVKEAATGGMAEVELGNVAKSKGSNDAVKSFGDQMVTDHTKANDELKSLAQQKSWTLPTDLDAQHKSKRDKMNNMSGAQFDKMYMKEMVKDHQKDVNQFRKCSQSCSDPDLKAWAGKTLPTLEHHLQMAQDAQKQVSGSAASSGDNSGKPSPSKKSKKSSASSSSGSQQ